MAQGVHPSEVDSGSPDGESADRVGMRAVLHPARFEIARVQFEVVTVGPVSDEEAAKIVMHFCRSRRPTESDRGKLIRIVTLFDRESANLLG
jgi:hypothetical protein